MKRPKEVLSIRIDKELKAKIKKEALAQQRSETNLVTVILTKYFEDKKRFDEIAESR